MFHNHLTTVEQRSYQIPLGYFRGKSNTNITRTHITQTALKTDMREKIKQCSVNQSLISLSIFFLICLPFLFIFFCLFFFAACSSSFCRTKQCHPTLTHAQTCKGQWRHSADSMLQGLLLSWWPTHFSTTVQKIQTHTHIHGEWRV